MLEYVLLLSVCVGTICFHHPPNGGWSSKEACLLPVDEVINQTEANLDSNPQFADHEHRFSWACVTDEELHRGTFRLTNHRTLGGKWTERAAVRA